MLPELLSGNQVSFLSQRLSLFDKKLHTFDDINWIKSNYTSNHIVSVLQFFS